ncbi:MAG: hypothetical protein KIT68_07380 [Phycisphaeraceae bacterium]|nr:hypothetical protein [Phycisphaeraceae bacterium]
MKIGRVFASACSVLLSAGAAFAAPQESVTFTSVPSNACSGCSQNTVLTHAFTGGYAVGAIRISGSLTEINAATFGSEARILVTPPVGTPFVVQATTTTSFTGTLVIAEFVHPTNAGITNAAGTWSFRFYESLDDTADFLADATWDTVTITLDDDPEPVVTTLAPSGGNYAEVEPNDWIYVGNRIVGMAPGETISGNTTGAVTATTSPFGTPTSADNFRITTTTAPAGIYKNQLVITTSGTAGHIGSIRGLVQASQGAGLPGMIAQYSDSYRTGIALQTSTTTTTPPRMNQWYSFGQGETLEYRVTGTTSTSGDYSVSFTRTAETPIIIGTSLVEGPITFTRGTGNTTTVDMWLYDGSFNAIADAGNAGNNTLTRTLAPGTYYLAVSNANTANNLASPADDTTRTGVVLRLPGAVANSSTTLVTNLSMAFSDLLGTQQVTASKAAAFDVVWFQFTVGPQVNPGGAGSAVPATVEQTRTTQLRVQVTPAATPPSTGIVVRADLQAFGGSAMQAFADAGGNLYTYDLVIPANQAVQSYTIPFTITDAQSRTGTGNIQLAVTPLSWNEALDGGGDAGELPGSAQTPIGSGPLNRISGSIDTGESGAADMYRIRICNPSAFSASTLNETNWDTQLFLFRDNGVGVLSEDNSAGGNITTQSLLQNNAVVTNVGNYYLAISRFNSDPRDAGNLALWTTDDNLAPNGPGAANPIASWSGSTSAAGTYAINLTGVCYYDALAPTPPYLSAGTIGTFEVTRTVLLTASVSPGSNPVSTAYSVTVDLTQLGGTASQVMFDNGTNGDVTPGDGVYSLAHTIPGTVSPGTVAMQFTVTDQVPRSSSVSLERTVAAKSWNELIDGGADAGNLPIDAQVPTGTDPFTRITGEISPGDPGGADMYAINICDAPNFSASTVGGTSWDTQLFLFRADGVGVLSEDDSTGLQTTLQNTAVVTATGPHYLAISRYNSDPRDASNQALWTLDDNQAPAGPGAANPVASWSTASAAGPYSISMTGVCYFDPLAPTPPTIAAATIGLFEPTRTVLLTATVGSGTNPASTSYTVTVDLSQVGGSGTQAMYDDGSNGDLVLGDGTYSYAYTIPGSASLGPVSLTFTVTDQVPRSSSATLNRTVAEKSWNELVDGGADAGELPATAQVPLGTDPFTRITGSIDTGDTGAADMYRIAICDAPSFSASTVGGTSWDTQLFLFDSAGVGVLSEDDTVGVQTTLQNPAVVTLNGEYYLAISRYNSDPRDELNQALWTADNNTAPNGPGAANAIASWTGTTAAAGPYAIAMTGVCYSSGGTPGCNPADVATEGSAQPFIDGPDGFITGTDFDVFVQAFFQEIRRPEPTGPYIADLTNGDGTGGPDGFVTGADFDFFIVKFFAGCP